MNQFLKKLILPAIIGLLLVLPLMILEYVNRRQFHEGYPTLLFVMLWLLGTGFAFSLLATWRDLRARKNLMERPIILALRIAALIACGWIWVAIVLDQMPCFLGARVCG
jgi:hypothetical protein